jgi:hypothetical protein
MRVGNFWYEYGGEINTAHTVDAGDLTGTTLASGVVTSSLTAVGTIVTGTWTGTAVGDTYISSASTWNGKQDALTFGISNTNVTKAGSGIVDDDFIRVDGTTFEGRSASEVLSDIGGQASLSFGISNTNVTKCGSGIVDDDFIRIDGTTMEGRSASEVLSDIGASAVAGSSSIVTVGTITSGTWTGTDIAIADGGTGQGTAQLAINALTAVSGGTNEYVLTKDTSTGNALWKEASGGGTTWEANHDFDTYYYDMEIQSKPSDPSADNARFYVKEVDSDNDGLFCLIRKNGAFEETQIV